KKDIVDVDKELETIITANGVKFKLSQPQNTDKSNNPFSIMFGHDAILASDKNKINEYLKVDQMPTTTNLLNW
ncbi:22974_t:CDS:2, partial [Gigaspora margarita]